MSASSSSSPSNPPPAPQDAAIFQEALQTARRSTFELHLIAKEKVCFQTLASSAKSVRIFLDLQKTLSELGVDFYLINYKNLYTTHVARITAPPPSAGWTVLRVFCQFQRLLCTNKDSLEHAETRKFLHTCLETADRFPAYREPLSIITTYFRMAELEKQIKPLLCALSCPIGYWKICSFTCESKPIVEKILEADEAFGKIQKHITAPVVQSLNGVEIDAGKEAAKKFFYAYNRLINIIETAIKQFETEAFPKLSGFYSRNYEIVTRIAQHCQTSIPELFSQVFPEDAIEKKAPQIPNQEVLLPWILETLASFDIKKLPSPEELQAPLLGFSHTFFVDKCQKEREKQKMALLSESARLRSFLPRSLWGIEQTEKQPAPKRYTEQKHRSPPSPSPFKEKRVVVKEISPQIEPKTDQKTAVLETPSSPKIPPAQDDQTAAPAAAASSSSLAPIQDQAQDEESSFPVKVGDRADLSLQYTDHVARWAIRDVFSTDDDYKTKKYSAFLQKEIRLCHLPPLAVVPVMVKLGKQFIMSGSSSSQIRFSLPGEIIQDNGSYDKGVLTLSKNRSTGEFSHMFFTKKTPIELIREYAKLGFFMVDEQEFAPVKTHPSRYRQAPIKLQDDGSFVSEVSEEHISIRNQAQGVTLNLYPFPELF